MGLSFPTDKISKSLNPGRFTISQGSYFANGQISNFSVYDKEKTFRKKTKVFNSNVFDTFAIERVYHIGKLSITCEEAWKLPRRLQ